jgi:hypothetical protein
MQVDSEQFNQNLNSNPFIVLSMVKTYYITLKLISSQMNYSYNARKEMKNNNTSKLVYKSKLYIHLGNAIGISNTSSQKLVDPIIPATLQATTQQYCNPSSRPGTSGINPDHSEMPVSCPHSS